MKNNQNLFFSPEEKGRAFSDVLKEVQEYISSKYSTLMVEGGSEEVKQQVKRYITKYICDYRITVKGKTQEQLIDDLYTEMAEFSFLTKYIFGTGIEEIDINSWRDIEIQYNDGRCEKLEEHFESPEHAVNVIRRIVHAFHYIEKPISRERMYCCLDDAFRLIPHNEAYINFTSDNVTVRLDYKDIIFIKADRHYTIICDCCNNIYQPYIYFTALTKPLMSDERFLQLSRGILCNMDYITGFSKDCCNLSNNTFLPITIRNAKKLEQAWRNYTFDKLHRLVDR